MQSPRILSFFLACTCLLVKLNGQSDSIWNSRISKMPNSGMGFYTQLSKVNYPSQYGEMIVGFQYSIDGNP